MVVRQAFLWHRRKSREIVRIVLLGLSTATITPNERPQYYLSQDPTVSYLQGCMAVRSQAPVYQLKLLQIYRSMTVSFSVLPLDILLGISAFLTNPLDYLSLSQVGPSQQSVIGSEADALLDLPCHIPRVPNIRVILAYLYPNSTLASCSTLERLLRRRAARRVCTVHSIPT